MEHIVERMQDEGGGVSVKNVKTFMNKIPSVFTGNEPLTTISGPAPPPNHPPSGPAHLPTHPPTGHPEVPPTHQPPAIGSHPPTLGSRPITPRPHPIAPPEAPPLFLFLWSLAIESNLKSGACLCVFVCVFS